VQLTITHKRKVNNNNKTDVKDAVESVDEHDHSISIKHTESSNSLETVEPSRLMNGRLRAGTTRVSQHNAATRFTQATLSSKFRERIG
jgi:hypothetical protein